MFSDPALTDRINSFALVSYIPEPLAGFLNRLRQVLVPNCFLRAHVTILPPRPASAPSEAAWDSLRDAARRFRPFVIELNTVEVFPVSDVIYISIGKGERELREMHTALNIDGLAFQELYPYHPHITLAQGLRPDELDELIRVARARWEEFRLDTSFTVETISFVQSTRRKTWVDLAECKLPADDSIHPFVAAKSRPVLHR